MTFSRAQKAIDAAVTAGAFPAAVIEVGRRAGAVWQQAFGRLTYDDTSPVVTLSTVFDLASLTKVIATASVAMQQVAAGRWDVDMAVASHFATWRRPDRDGIRVRHLLDHSSGLAAHARLWESANGRPSYEAAILDLPIERPPGVAAVYSDPGFILLGLLLEDLGDASLDRQFSRLADAIEGDLAYRPPPSWRDRTAPTEFDPWRGRLLQGEVHDENAAALGGVAGHAGLFGTAPAVGAFARLVLRTFAETTPLGTPALMRTFAARSTVTGSSRALAWDTMLPTSSCGTKLSPTAIGHTGFTGTSLWIDQARDVYVVLLTNRVHPTRAHNILATARPLIHDAVMTDLEAGN